MTCKDCLHDGVCHLQEMSTGLELEEYIKEFGCEDYISNTDFVEVVRCKDCKHIYKARSEKNTYYCTLGFNALKTEPTHFCSYGERRDT